jgi:hypothetical protein
MSAAHKAKQNGGDGLLAVVLGQGKGDLVPEFLKSSNGGPCLCSPPSLGSFHSVLLMGPFVCSGRVVLQGSSGSQLTYSVISRFMTLFLTRGCRTTRYMAQSKFKFQTAQHNLADGWKNH